MEPQWDFSGEIIWRPMPEQAARSRLVAEINFQKRVLFIRCILTHKEYARGAWKR